jgi:hypothetical protein
MKRDVVINPHAVERRAAQYVEQAALVSVFVAVFLRGWISDRRTRRGAR